MKALLEKIRKILESRRTRQLLTRTVSGVAAIVVFITTYALVLPAITMEQDALCGIPEHQHIDACYEERLVCEIPEDENHHHDAACYEKFLICGNEVHVHSAACYQQDGSAVVSLGSTTAASTDFGTFSEPEQYDMDGFEYDTGTDVTDNAVGEEALMEETAEEEAAFAQAVDEESEKEDIESEDLGTEGTDEGTTVYEANPNGSDNGDGALEDMEQESPADADDSDLTTDSNQNAADSNLEASGSGSSENMDAAASNPEKSESQVSEEGKAISEEETGSQDEQVNIENENLDPDLGNLLDENDGSGSVSETSETSDREADTSDGDWEANDSATDTAGAETEIADTAATAEEAANDATTNVLPEPVETENLSSGFVPELDSIEFGSVLNKHTDFFYFHPEEGQELPANSSDITDWKRVKNSLFGSTKLKPTDLVKMYLSYTVPAGSLNETNQVARFRLPSNIHLTDDQIIAINNTENGMSALYADAAHAAAEIDEDTLDGTDDETHDEGSEMEPGAEEDNTGMEDAGIASGTDEEDREDIESSSDSGEQAQDENAANYQKYLGVEAIEGTRTPDEKLKVGAQEYISAIVKAENVFDDEGLYGEKGAFLGQDLIFIFTPYSIEKNQTIYNADGDPVSAGEKITGWFVCDFNMSQIDWVEEDTDLDNSTVEKTAEVIFVEKDSEKNVKEISRKLKLVDTTEEHSDAANGGETAAAAETASVAETAVASESAAAAETASETAAADETSLASTGNTSERADEEETQNSPFKSGTLTADGDGYRITLDYTEEAKIPENAELSVREITAETDREAYEACLEQAGQQMAADDKTSVDQKASRFFDIEILVKDLVKDTDSDGKTEVRKIEPSAPVSVNIQIIDSSTSESAASGDKQTNQSDPAVLHFAEEGVEQIGSTVKTSEEQDNNKDRNGSEEPEPTTEISFEAESFSIYGVVYTVDFHWEVNGKTYEFNIPGGGFVSLTELVEVLGILGDTNPAENASEKEETDREKTDTEAASIILEDVVVTEETRKFVADVESVVFSNPDLVWIRKVDVDSKVGELKEANGLKCEYSAALTEEQIAEINAQTVEAGDWALISMLPFNTEESLTVTMKDGNQFVVKVTDEQLTGQLTNGGKYLIYYNSGSGSNQTYNVLRNDGYVYSTTDSSELDGLGDEYLWTFDGFERDGEEYSLIHNGTTYICLDGTSSGIFSNTAIPTYLLPFNDEYKGFLVYGKEFIHTVGPYGYNLNSFLTFDNGGFIRDYNPFGNTRIKLWEQEERKYKFTVKTEYINAFRGTVSGYDQNNEYQSNVTSYIGITNGQKKNSNAITATPGPGYLFKEWRLGDTVLDITSSTIDAGALILPEDNMILTAVFKKDPNQPNVGFPDYSGKIEEWKQNYIEKPVSMDKTAKVYDYDNRIYEIGMDVSAEAKVIAPNVDMAFVTDVSRSMYTPAKLKEVGSYSKSSKEDLINQLNSLYNRGIAGADGDKVYYLIADEDNSSLVFAVRKFNTGSQYKYWKWIDCSYDDFTYKDKKGSLSNPNGANTGSYGVDKTWADGNNGAGYLYERVYDFGNNGTIDLQQKELNGKIYVAEDVHYRLDYLTQAVDIVSDVLYTVNSGARTGLVTFAGTANDPVGLYGKDEYGELINALNNISPDGGTDQEAGLNKAQNLWSTASDENHQRAVILITDGAPNYSGNTTREQKWEQIAAAAQALNTQKNVTVNTVGLSIENVTGAREGLEATASAGGGGKSLTASDGMGLVDSVLDIISTYLKDANYKGTLHDDLDPAFYPVKKDGTPITQGYYDVEGNPLTMEQVQIYNENGTEYYLWKYKNGGSWSITWYNLEFGRGTAASPATHKDIYVKAKEDFMGGNKISTNYEYAHAIATRAVFRNGHTTTETPLEVIKEGKADTPYVNIDELHLTEHETEWTVYLGTDVTPKEQLEALWDNIKVKQVVKKEGTIPAIPADEDNPEGIPADVTRMKDVNQMWYTHNTSSVDESDVNEPANSADCSKLPVSYYGLDSYYDELLGAITSGNSYDSGDISYDGYGHSPGKFRITATKTIVNGAVDASGKAPNQHTTDKAASPAETYKITVRYTPVTSGAAETYENTTAGGKAGKVTAGTGNDEVKSENEHKINVIKKGLGIEKVDEDGAKITEYNAAFKLFRPVTASETGSSVTGLPAGTYKEIATLTTNAGTAVLSNALEELRKLPDGQHYYLVETQEPTGYQKLSGPVQVDVSVTPGPQTKPYEQSEGITTLINIGQPVATISFSGDGAAAGTHTENTFVLKITNKAANVDISIHKTDNQQVALPGATFKLMNGSQIVNVSAEGTGVVVLPKDSDESVTISDNTFTIPAGGVSIQNIPVSDNVYSIVEVDAPDGYVITNNTPSTFKVTGGKVTDEQHIEGVTYNPETMDFVIPNNPGVELPSTGGPGTSTIYFFGVMLTGLAGTCLVMRMRRKAA